MTTPPLETVSVGTKAPLGRSETDSLVDQEGVREAIARAFIEGATAGIMATISDDTSEVIMNRMEANAIQ